MNTVRGKLFRLYADAIPLNTGIYVPDCLGEYSPYLDPRHDSLGRELVNCFLVDSKGHIAMFLNRRPCDYVPYRILFHLDAYNRFMQDYFPEGDDDEIYPEEGENPTTYDDRFYQKVRPVYDYIHGELSLRQANSFSFIEKLFWLIKAFFITRFDKKLRAEKFRQWHALKRYYQKKAIYVFAPSPDYTRLIRIFSPNRMPAPGLAEQVSVFAQSVPLDFSSTRCIEFSDLRKMWELEIHQGPTCVPKITAPNGSLASNCFCRSGGL